MSSEVLSSSTSTSSSLVSSKDIDGSSSTRSSAASILEDFSPGQSHWGEGNNYLTEISLCALIRCDRSLQKDCHRT